MDSEETPWKKAQKIGISFFRPSVAVFRLGLSGVAVPEILDCAMTSFIYIMRTKQKNEKNLEKKRTS